MLPTLTPRLSLLLLLALIALSWWSVYLTRPPQAKPAMAPPTEFSAERAMQHIRQIAREPHAMGTPGHARVRTYLINTLRSLGLDPQVQEATVVGQPTNPQSPSPSGAMLGLASRVGYTYNVMARLRGKQPGNAQPGKARPRKALLLVAHYDSQPNALGAADDGAGVAAILEAVRAMRQGPSLQHDVILLFTDGEEYGLFGASAFLRHPWAKDVGFVINLEARGNSGPSQIFETNPQNGWVVEQVARAVPHPMASSLAYEIYKQLPNSTDFTVFRDAGYAGVNAAFIDGFVHYHKLTDSPDNLNPNSVQHQGENLLALARHVGNAPLDAVRAPDKVFFNGAGHWLVSYPMVLNWLWMVLLTGAFIAAFVVGFRQKKLTAGQVIGGMALSFGMLLLIGGFCLLVNLGITRALPLTHTFINGTYGSAQFFVAYALLTGGLFGLLVRLALRWLRPLSLIMGACGLVYGLTLTLFILLPAGVYLLLFPLLGALIGLLVVLWQTSRQNEARPMYALLLLIAALPTLFVILPIVQSLFVTFDLLLSVVPMLLLSLTLLVLLPLWLLIEAGLRFSGLRWQRVAVLPLLALLLGGIFAVTAIRNEAPTAGQPLHSHVSYFMNADTKRAVWASFGLLETDDWNRQFFPKPTTGKLTEIHPQTQPADGRTYLKNPAPSLPDLPPVARIISDRTTGSGRRLTLELWSPRGAAHLDLMLFPGQAGNVRAVRVNGESVSVKAQQTTSGPAIDLLLFGLPVSKKVQLTLDIPVGNSLRLLLSDQSIGLPPDLITIPRPAYVVPEQGRMSNLTVVGKTYQF
ncbi:M20/M25/M40 family metallo-hydrolase [Spirosoma arcticum]